MTSREKEIAGVLGACVLFTVVYYAYALIAHTGMPAIVKPVFWLAVSVFIWFRPRVQAYAKLRLVPFIIILVTVSAMVAVVSTFAAGFISGMGKSPFSRSAAGILMNLLKYATVPLMMEWARNYLLNGVERKRLPFIWILITLVFTSMQVNLLKFGGISNLEGYASLIGGELLPQLVLNGYLCYVVYLAGAMPAMLYIAITTIPRWFMPVLPDLSWLLNAIIGCVVPLISFMIMHDVYTKSTGIVKPGRKKENPYSWLAVLVVCVLVIWFVAGLFPVYPVTIMSGSMEPVFYAGDIVIIEKADASLLKKGDIVQYWSKDMFVIHRIVDTDKLNDETVYITKGDHNNVRDSAPVKAGQIKGKVISTIPKLGLLTYWLRSR